MTKNKITLKADVSREEYQLNQEYATQELGISLAASVWLDLHRTAQSIRAMQHHNQEN
jgi:hypothetical protein